MPFTLAILVTVLSYTWYLAPRLPREAVSVAGVIVVALAFWHDVRAKEWGFDMKALVPGLRAATIFTAPLVLVILAAGAAAGTLHAVRGGLTELGALVMWGGAQQWVLQTVVLREAQHATSRRLGGFLAALLFAILHLPNPMLSAVTLVGALGWCAIYDRHANIIPLALSHALGTLALLYAFDDGLTGGLRVGAAFLTRRG